MPLHFELVTPERLVRSEDVYMVVVPGTEGDFGVLEGHAPVMSTIRYGALSVYRTEKGEPETIRIQAGFAAGQVRGIKKPRLGAGLDRQHVVTQFLQRIDGLRRCPV